MPNIPLQVDLFNNKIKAEVVSVLEDELLNISNHFVCYSLQKLSTVVYRLDGSKSLYEYSLNRFTTIIVVFSYLK